MPSLNAIPRKAHKECPQPKSRKKFRFLEKHKDNVVRAKAFHKKEEALQRLREKAAFRNPDEFYFKMIKTKTIDGVHHPEYWVELDEFGKKSEANKCTQDELMIMKTQDIGYVLQKLQSERKNIKKLTAVLHSLDYRPSSKHIYYAEDRKTASSYRELEGQKNRANQLDKLYMDMAMHKELQKNGRKRKLREDEIIQPTSKPVYKWRTERKR